MAPTQTPWTTLLLEEKPGHNDFTQALINIEGYYLQLQKAMESEAVRDQFVLHPDKTHSHLLRSFDVLQNKNLPSHVADMIFEIMVIPFIGDKTFSQEQTIQLVGAALPLLIKNPTQYLRDVTGILLCFDQLLDHLIANDKYATVLKALLLSKKFPLPLALVEQLGSKLLGMCSKCSADHETSAIAESWEIAHSLIASLNEIVEDVSKEEHSRTRSENLPPLNLPSLKAMKVLSVDDKKTMTQKVFKKELNIPDEVIGHLKHFNLPTPTFARGIANAVERLQNDTIPALVRSALETFPCRCCLDRLTKGNSVDAVPNPLMVPIHGSTDVIEPQDIFGKRVGIWKVLLSDVAFKNIQKFARAAGQFAPMEKVLRAIASGDWKGKNLSRIVGSKEQRSRMRVPIMEAPISSTVSILWQIDIGFYDELPWVQQQVAKVWQVVSSEKEINPTVEQLLLIQESYTDAVVKLCSYQPIKQSDGARVPRQYGNVKDTGSNQFWPIARSNASQALIDMASKFYNLTEPLLDIIANDKSTEEFPFDLSPEELEIVKHFSTSTLILGRSGTGKTTCLLFKMIAKHRARQSAIDLGTASEDQQLRQLLLTRSSYLASKLRSYAKGLMQSELRPLGVRDEDDERSVIHSFFALKKSHFPVVCTYDEFLSLLESTIRMVNRKDFLKDLSTDHSKNTTKDISRSVIDFSLFKIEYWGCLHGLVPASCSPELLFAEIMGVIKGSSITAKTLMPLTREEYVKKNSKASPAFGSELEREKVFVAFERYEKQKKQRKEIDELDRVSFLLKSLKNNPPLAEQIRRCFGEIYVDEIQDLRCLDIILLLGCLSDARRIHLAGDTAQCISKDSVFRFPEIKALFYEYYEAVAKELNQPSIAKPVQFSLAKNYRSHQGILSFASWVMQLLWNGFPETIDKLDPEIGQIGGPQPIIFAGFESNVLFTENIGLVRLNDNVAGFGAEQVILVRDDISKIKLQSQIGEIALVLTILESKGMEFDDVLVYDFFGGSGLGSSYRCLHILVQPSQTHFDSQKHAALCSELKSLYVAVTRARKQLWFMETQEHAVDPVLQALSQGTSLELAEVVRQDDPDVAEKINILRAGGSVDPKSWIKKAAHLFERKSFAEALFCYKKANDSRGMIHSQACLHEQKGRSHRAAGEIEDFTKCFEEAITLFLKIGLNPEAASCYEGLGRLDKVAEIWKDCGQYDKAASFYEKGKYFSKASECYHSCSRYEEAIEVLRRGDCFDEIVTYASRYRRYLIQATVSRYSRLCNILLKQGRVSPALRETTINMLGSDPKKIQFFKEFEMWDQLAALYADKCRWFELFTLFMDIGEVSSALTAILTQNLVLVVERPLVEKIFHYAMAELWYNSLNISPNKIQWLSLLEQIKAAGLEQLSKQWDVPFGLLGSFNNPNNPVTVRTMEVDVIKDFFCLFLISYEPPSSSEMSPSSTARPCNSYTSIFDRSVVAHLPMDVVGRVGRILLGVDAGDPYYLQSLAFSCGIFTNPKQPDQAVVVHWSPLIEYSDSPIYRLPLDKLLSLASSFIREHFTTAVAQLYEAAWELFKKEFHSPCMFYLSRGFCAKSKIGDCPWNHETPTETQARAKMDILLDISEIFARLTPLYYNRTMPEEFSRHFLGQRRKWIGQVQNESVLFSSLEQSSDAIASLISNLQTNPDYAGTAQCLEELLFYRMAKQWKDCANGGLSYFMMMIQEAQALGPDSVARFERVLIQKIRYMPIRDPFSRPHYALKAASRIRSAVERRSAGDFYNSVRDYVACLAQADKSYFELFHSLLSVLEFAVTYVICVATPHNGVVLPWSWAMVHLPRIMQSQAKLPVEVKEIRVHLSSLHIINHAFETLLHQINLYIDRGELKLRGMGYATHNPTSMNIMIKRRCTELLTTMIINIDAWPIEKAPSEYRDMRRKAHSTIRSNMSPGMSIDFTSIDKLRQSFISAYKSYNNKDGLCVITLDDEEPGAQALRLFLNDKAQFSGLSQVLTLAKLAVVHQPTGQGEVQGDGYTESGLKAIIRVQQRWRKVVNACRINLNYRQTRIGHCTCELVELCSQVFSGETEETWPFTRKLCMRKVIFTDVLKLIMSLYGVLDDLRNLRNEWRNEWENEFSNHHSIAKVEELTLIRDKIMSLGANIENLRCDWAFSGIRQMVLSTPHGKVSAAARKAQRGAIAAGEEIQETLLRIGAVAEASL